MRDVVQKVIEAEAEAKRLVQAAQAEAERILAEAQNQGQQLITRARQEARTEAERMVEAAVRAAEQEKQKRLAHLAAEIESSLRLDEATRRHAVAAAIRCVCGKGQP